MSRPLSFNQIEAFRAVVLTGTTVAAARMLYTTQPSISRLIHQAQKASGLKLFTNDRGRLQLTREGRQLFETIQLHYQGLERIEQTATALRASGAGIFRIASTPSLAQGVLPKVLGRFMRDWPHVHLNVQTPSSRLIEDGLRQGMFDVAITNMAFAGAEFVAHEIHQCEAVLVCAPDHALSSRKVVRITDLRGQTMISLPAHDVLQREINKAFEAHGLDRHANIETIYSATICAFAAQGLGVGIVNPYVAQLFRDGISIKRYAPKLPVRTYAMLAKFAPASELVERFLLALRSVMNGRD